MGYFKNVIPDLPFASGLYISLGQRSSVKEKELSDIQSHFQILIDYHFRILTPEKTSTTLVRGYDFEVFLASLREGTSASEGTGYYVIGREGLSAEEALKLRSYNALVQSSMPEEWKYYKAEEECFESSHEAFRTAFPRGFAWEVIAVYSGPPVIAYKFRHEGFFEGSFKGHAPTGEMVQFYSMGLLKVDESLRVEEVKIYYDPAELFGGLLKRPSAARRCPFHK
ncbi:pathogen-related protein-like [Diospyros lotus]|uniref:pathogen-related protein-like n=1 Tax=Diospyros lotus TaxID=55363 RepID=UPI00224D01CE|nr:pathogen-related protein-like [Diospyros lotus]